MSTIMKGQVVGVHYVGTFDDGTEFDNSRTRGNPLFFRVGERQVINGFETAVMGMSVGETKNFVVTPEQAYGHNDPNLLREVPRNNFPTDFAFKEGMVVEMKSPQGKPFPAQVTSFTQDAVTLDFNHPLSGKTLNLEIELVKTEDSEETTTTKGET